MPHELVDTIVNEETKNGTDKIVGALFKAKQKMDAVIKKGENPHFKSKYAKLEDVLEACQPALEEHGILLLQPLGKDHHGNFVETSFTHVESQQELVCNTYLPSNVDTDIVKFCAAVTFARKHSILSFLCLPCEDPDLPKEINTVEKIAELKALAQTLEPAKAKIALSSIAAAANDPKELGRIENRIKVILGGAHG